MLPAPHRRVQPECMWLQLAPLIAVGRRCCTQRESSVAPLLPVRSALELSEPRGRQRPYSPAHALHVLCEPCGEGSSSHTSSAAGHILLRASREIGAFARYSVCAASRRLGQQQSEPTFRCPALRMNGVQGAAVARRSAPAGARRQPQGSISFSHAFSSLGGSRCGCRAIVDVAACPYRDLARQATRSIDSGRRCALLPSDRALTAPLAIVAAAFHDFRKKTDRRTSVYRMQNSPCRLVVCRLGLELFRWASSSPTCGEVFI